MTPAKACPHPGCSGAVTPTGYCLASGERVDPATGRHSAPAAETPPPAPLPPPPAPVPSQRSPYTASYSSEGDARGESSQFWIVHPGPAALPERPALVTLPPESPDPTVLPEITLLERADSAGAHADPGGLPLPPGTLLAGQYRLVRLLGYGGMGDVCLAHDTKVDDRAVAIKMLHAELAADSYSLLRGERKELVELNHDGFIRVFNYGHHAGVGDFLVLQYVDGLTLREVGARARAHPEEFGHERFREFTLAYGMRILAGLAYLHAPGRGKVYGDLKPPNVMHDGSTIKLIDVGSVRRAGAPGLTTDDYRAPSVGDHGESDPRDDLFSLGETLRTLCGLGADRHDLAALSALGPLDDPAAGHRGLGLVSLARVLRRATRTHRADRFATAREMEDQLRGVFRELRSLRTGAETFEPSPLFLQSAHALDGGLGSAPALSRWAAPRAAARHPAPTPAQVARRLPVPRPDPDDDHHGELSRLADDDPEALLQHTGDWPDSPEVHLLRCRLRLRLTPRADDGPPDAEALSAAETALALAEDAIGPARAPHDWRLDWHRGLLELARSRVGAARDHFDRVYAAIPGEYAPKLALGHCAEHLERRHEALTFYEAVRLRNPSLGSAAFGAARARLALGGPDALADAIAALDAVPQHSRHRTAARTAAVRIRADHARDADGLGTAVRALAGLFFAHGLTDEQARVRMKAEVWGAAHRLLAPPGGGPPLTGAGLRAVAAKADPRLEFPADERTLRKDLSRFYRGLAHQAARDAPPREAGAPLAELLLDRAYAVRPFALRHHRDTPWLGKKIKDWVRAGTSAQRRG